MIIRFVPPLEVGMRSVALERYLDMGLCTIIRSRLWFKSTLGAYLSKIRAHQSYMESVATTNIVEPVFNALFTVAATMDGTVDDQGIIQPRTIAVICILVLVFLPSVIWTMLRYWRGRVRRGADLEASSCKEAAPQKQEVSQNEDLQEHESHNVSQQQEEGPSMVLRFLSEAANVVSTIATGLFPA
ncbi:hypothetical protein B0H21DRAFT_734277 [Amylocystis lapponica]|nr:hypothetical protein B0H21DRAFT_734277 [Amylocystis lapponica]